MNVALLVILCLAGQSVPDEAWWIRVRADDKTLLFRPVGTGRTETATSGPGQAKPSANGGPLVIVKADAGTPVATAGVGELLRLPPFGRKFGAWAEYIVIPALALLASLILFGIFVTLFGKNPLDLYFFMYQGAFGT